MRSGDNQRCYKPLVKAEKMLRAVTITTEGSGTIAPVYRAIKVVVSPTQSWGHGINVVEVGKRRVWKLGAGVQHFLSKCPYPCPLLIIGYRPRKWIVDDANGISVVTFQATADLP